jgi:hypothetical protein
MSLYPIKYPVVRKDYVLKESFRKEKKIMRKRNVVIPIYWSRYLRLLHSGQPHGPWSSFQSTEPQLSVELI